ncbi:MAG: cache domain-containing sensor histidine kinase [Betaproteobacteria bacterium]
MDRRVGEEAKVVNRRRALRASLVYAVLALAWIVASDWLLEWMAYDAVTQSALQTYKGWAFIAVTATLLYFFLRRMPPPLAAERPGAFRGDRRLRVLVGTVTALLILAIAAGLSLNLWSERKALLASAAQDSRNLVHIIEEQTSASINAADLALRVLEGAINLQAGFPGGSRALEAQMRQHLSLLPFLGAFLHLDANGRVLHQSNLRPATRLEIARRDFFLALRDRATDELYVGEPFVSERSGTPIFTLSRRLQTPDGAFAGVLSAAVDIGYFERLYGGLHTRYGRAIALARRDGVVLARHPQVQGLAGRSFAATRLFSEYLSTAPSGTFRGVSAVDGMTRIFSYRTVPERPMVALLGLNEDDILGPWWRQALAYAGIALAGTLTLLWLAFLTLRGLSRRERLLEELRRSEERFRALSDQLLQVQEAERANLARELHDEFGQTLTATKLQLQMLGQRAPSPFLEDCIALVDQGLKQVRTLSLDLRPPQLDRLGLAAALRAHAGRLSQQTGLAVTFEDAPGLPGLTGARAAACFRIVQEALTNALRHARAQSVRVKLAVEQGVLWLEVADDGAGFDLEAKRARAAQGGSLGLLSMEERAHLLGGTLQIHTSAGRGTRIVARVPLWTAEEAAA